MPLRHLLSPALLFLLACSDTAEEEVPVQAAAPAAALPATPAATLPSTVVQKAADTDGPEFLSLFTAPVDTIKVTADTPVRLWDLIGVVQSPTGDPRTQLPAGSAIWTQVDGPTASIDQPGTTNATVRIGAGAVYTFRLSITNASGGRSMDLSLTVPR